MHKLSEVTVSLERDSQHTPWGIRLVGGSDLDTPLIITKVGELKTVAWCMHAHSCDDLHQLLEGGNLSVHCVTNCLLLQVKENARGNEDALEALFVRRNFRLASVQT